jgi:short-subunit dehydrogenase
MTTNTTTPTTLITGATDGLGLHLARHYLTRGHRLVLLGRRPLDSLSDDPLFHPSRYCQADLSQPGYAETMLNFLHAQQITQLDYLVHNAGTGYFGPFYEQSPESINAVMAVNLTAPLTLTHALLPHIKQAQGKLVFISSVVASLPVPEYAVYGGSKAALDGFARSLRVELGHSAAVQVIHPGASRTGMHAKVGLTQADLNWERFPPAAQVAQQIANAIATPRPSVTLGLGNSLAYYAGLYFGGFVE